MSSVSSAVVCSLICASLLFPQVSQPTYEGGFIAVKDFGAKGDGISDDTAAIQAAINLFSQHVPTASRRGGTIYFPSGVYLISSPLFYYGSPGTGIRLQGDLGRTRGSTYGSTIRWNGGSGATMFIAVGMNNSQFENIDFDCNNLARIGIHLAATNTINTTLGTAVAPGSQTVTPGNMAGISAGAVVNVDSGVSMEMVYVTATTKSTFTAIFTKNH